jgi:peroxiredoxin
LHCHSPILPHRNPVGKQSFKFGETLLAFATFIVSGEWPPLRLICALLDFTSVLWRFSFADMAVTPSTMLELGTTAPEFALPDTSGKIVCLTDFKGAAAVVVLFICNHCPYVKHIADALAQFGRDYQGRNVAVVAINSNDAEKYPNDGPQAMKEEAAMRGYTFPYLFDDTQAVAKAYHAACTPDIYVFDGSRKLVYRGQFDASRPRKGQRRGQIYEWRSMPF